MLGLAQAGFILTDFHLAILVGLAVLPVRKCENEERSGGTIGQDETPSTVPQHTPNWRRYLRVEATTTVQTTSVILAESGAVKWPVTRRYWPHASLKVR